MGSPFPAPEPHLTSLTQAVLKHKHKYLSQMRSKPRTRTLDQTGTCSPVAVPILFSLNLNLAKACKNGQKKERKGCLGSPDRDAAFLPPVGIPVSIPVCFPSHSLPNPAKTDYSISFNDSALLLPLIY